MKKLIFLTLAATFCTLGSTQNLKDQHSQTIETTQQKATEEGKALLRRIAYHIKRFNYVLTSNASVYRITEDARFGSDKCDQGLQNELIYVVNGIAFMEASIGMPFSADTAPTFITVGKVDSNVLTFTEDRLSILRQLVHDRTRTDIILGSIKNSRCTYEVHFQEGKAYVSNQKSVIQINLRADKANSRIKQFERVKDHLKRTYPNLANEIDQIL
jgi:hypothetical protein